MAPLLLYKYMNAGVCVEFHQTSYRNSYTDPRGIQEMLLCFQLHSAGRRIPTDETHKRGPYCIQYDFVAHDNAEFWNDPTLGLPPGDAAKTCVYPLPSSAKSETD